MFSPMESSQWMALKVALQQTAFGPAPTAQLDRQLILNLFGLLAFGTLIQIIGQCSSERW